MGILGILGISYLQSLEIFKTQFNPSNKNHQVKNNLSIVSLQFPPLMKLLCSKEEDRFSVFFFINLVVFSWHLLYVFSSFKPLYFGVNYNKFQISFKAWYLLN